jgi:DnaJ-like protein
MTKRKPPNMTFPGWVEQQIQVAEAQGAFANLPGHGRPIADLDRPHDELEWLAGYLRRENVDVAEVLPPALALAKEVEDLGERVARIPSEVRVGQVVDDLNARIDRAYARPQVGPPLRVKKVKVDEVLHQWRVTRAALAPPPPPVDRPPPARIRRRWLRRVE